jgi:hypothetical protein
MRVMADFQTRNHPCRNHDLGAGLVLVRFYGEHSSM